MPLFEPVLSALDRHGARYVVVGGVAVVLHGHPRLTADLDLALDLTANYPARAVDALVEIGLTPLLPVAAHEFADAAVRQQWVDERNLKVFTFVDPAEPLRQVDLFATNPVPFEELWERAVEVTLGPNIVRIASIDDLVAMKELASRPQGLADYRRPPDAAPGPGGHMTTPDYWDGGWEAHRTAQARSWLASTPAQRLAWLEEAIRFAHEYGRQGRPSPSAAPSGLSGRSRSCRRRSA